MEHRKLEESEFHDRQTKKSFSKKFYSITRSSQRYIWQYLNDNCPGKTILDYGCGSGEHSLKLAQNGALVYGIDISRECIESAIARLKNAGFADRSKFSIMDAEHLQFEAKKFDYILAVSVLHHLDCEQAFFELARVLKPGGKVFCIEPLAYNPVIQWYRKNTPHMRTAWEMKHILTMKDMEIAKKFFKKVRIKFFHIFTFLAVPLQNTVFFNTVLSVLENIDAVITRIPIVRLMAWQIAFIMSEPRDSASGSKNIRP